MGEPNFFSFTGGIPLANGRLLKDELLAYGYDGNEVGEILNLISKKVAKNLVSGEEGFTSSIENVFFLPDDENNAEQELLYIQT